MFFDSVSDSVSRSSTPGSSASPTTTPTSSHTRSRGRSRGRARARSSLQERSAPPSSSGEEESWHDVTDADEEPVLFVIAPKRPPGPQLITSATYSAFFLTHLLLTQ